MQFMDYDYVCMSQGGERWREKMEEEREKRKRKTGRYIPK